MVACARLKRETESRTSLAPCNWMGAARFTYNHERASCGSADVWSTLTNTGRLDITVRPRASYSSTRSR